MSCPQRYSALTLNLINGHAETSNGRKPPPRRPSFIPILPTPV